MDDETAAPKDGRSTGQRRRRSRSPRKRQAILDAARTLFLQQGYAAASMDDVAALADVSKQTVYAHFTDKAGLFTALITLDIAHSAGSRHPLVEAMPATDDLDRDLREYARAHLTDVMQPDLLRMRRLIIGESERFPELARAWYDAGPRRSCQLFAGWFEVLDQRGLLRTPEPMLAAEIYNWLVLSIPLNQAMTMPLDTEPFTQRQLTRFADEGVRVFLAAYRP